MLLSKTVIQKWHSTVKKYYESKGYKFTKMKDEFEIKVEDLTDNSKIYVEVKCDNSDCENPYLEPMRWEIYKKYVHEDGKYYCKKCANKLFGIEKRNKIQLQKSKSFGQWCMENDRQDVLDRWDYELNNGIKPSEICYSTHKQYYFKCPRGLHDSELKNLHSFTVGEGNIKCKACHSFAQWGIDNISKDFLEKYWDYRKNRNINPWEISYGSNSKPKVYIKCQEDIQHNSYPILPNSFVNGIRCPICSKSKGEIKIRDYLVKNNINYTSQKEFQDLIGLGKNNLSYDFYLPELNLLIEYQGEQHEKYIHGLHKSKKDFEKQVEHDRRKREYANNHNIKLLEIWYWDFDNVEKILNKELNINNKLVKAV